MTRMELYQFSIYSEDSLSNPTQEPKNPNIALLAGYNWVGRSSPAESVPQQRKFPRRAALKYIIVNHSITR